MNISQSDNWHYIFYTLDSPKHVDITLTPSTPFTDYDLYTDWTGTCPTNTCDQTGPGEDETCSQDLPAGTYILGVNLSQGSGNYDLGLTCEDLSCEDQCTLNVYVWDEDYNALEAYIYVNDSYIGYNDYITVEVEEGNYTIEATKSGYDSDSETVTCPCNETKTVNLTLNEESEEATLELGGLDVDPDEICEDEDETIELSIPVTLESGPDDTEVKAKFYVEEDDDWDYIGKDEKELDEDQTRTFEIDYEYDADDLEEGSYDIKVVVSAGDVKETEYADLDVEDCDEELEVNVGYIYLDPSSPDEGDIVQVKVSVTLESSEDSEKVYVYAYIDDDKFYSTSETMDEDETEKFTFTFDTDDYSTGSHKIKVKAKVDSETDTSTRSFTIGETYAEEPDHCLSIDSITTDKPLQPNVSVKVFIDVMSCGEDDEDDVKAKVEAFSETYYTGYFDIDSGETEEVFVTVSVPDVSGKQTIKVTVWDNETSDSWSKDFAVSTGIPFIKIKKEFEVEECETEEINFTVENIGKVSDTFTLTVSGSAAEWITGVPEAVTLEADESMNITAYISVPCDTESGYYGFTITAEGSANYSATSSIHVVRPWRWPILTLPTGFFLFTGILAWLPWILLLLFIVFIVFLLAVLGKMYKSRRKPMFE